MLVTDLSKSFHPCPKNGQVSDKVSPKITKVSTKKKTTKQSNNKVLKTDFCIMPQSTKYSTKRTRKYCERHEVFFGRAYRNKSIKDGLIVFLTEENHRGKNGVHGKYGDKLNRHIKKLAQKAWMSYYNKTTEEFIERYGQNYI